MRYIILIISILLLAPVSTVSAVEKNQAALSKGSPPVTVSRIAAGTVGTVRYNYITVIYRTDKDSNGNAISDNEILFPVGKDTTFQFKKSLSEFVEGDKIDVVYDETRWIDENGVGHAERKARQIRFLGSPRKGLVSE